MSVSKMVLIGSWVSIFGLSWLMVLKWIPRDVFSWGFFIFFCILAFLSAASDQELTKKP